MLVSRRRSLPYGPAHTSIGTIAGCDLVGGTHPLDQVAVGREATGGELTAPPLHLDGVVAQPLIAGAGLGHGRFQG